MRKNAGNEIRAVSWILLILWLILLVYLSRQTGEETAELSGGITGWICALLERIGTRAEPASLHSLIRRAAHVMIYLILGFLLGRAFRLSFRGGWLIAVCLLLCFGIGILDEYQKAFIPGRHCHLSDVLLNCVSGIPGVLLGWFLPRGTNKRRE